MAVLFPIQHHHTGIPFECLGCSPWCSRFAGTREVVPCTCFRLSSAPPPAFEREAAARVVSRVEKPQRHQARGGAAAGWWLDAAGSDRRGRTTIPCEPPPKTGGSWELGPDDAPLRTHIPHRRVARQLAHQSHREQHFAFHASSAQRTAASPSSSAKAEVVRSAKRGARSFDSGAIRRPSGDRARAAICLR